MDDKNVLKGSSFVNEELDLHLFHKDPAHHHSVHNKTSHQGHHHPSSSITELPNLSDIESRERCDSIKSLRETLKSVSVATAKKKSKGLTQSPSHDDLLGLNFQIDVPKKSLTVPQPILHRHSVSLPVTPRSSPKLERKAGGLLRKLSGTNLMQMGVVPENSSNFSVVEMDKNNSSVACRDSQIKSANTKNMDVVSSRPSSQAANPSWLVSSGFSNFLKKKTNLDNKEMNAMAPSF